MQGIEKLILDPTEPDDDDVRGYDSGEDRSDRRGRAAASSAAAVPEVARPKLRSKGNTGVKAVLADYAEAQEKAHFRRQQEAEAQRRAIEKMSITVDPQKQDSNSNDKPDEFLLDEDDPILREYRQKRLGELAKQQKNAKPAAAQRRTFGFLSEITQAQYLAAIDGARHPLCISSGV